MRAQDLKNGKIVSDNPVYITRRYYESIHRSHIKPGYLLFSIMASIGNSAIVPDNFPAATANRAVGILAPLKYQPTLTKYLFYLFATDLGAQLYNRIKKGGLQQRTNLADISAMEFPLPPESKQVELVVTMDAAKGEWQRKLAEADDLLSSLDDFLLQTLGLTPPPTDERKVFAVPLQGPKAEGRLNPDYFHPERILTLRALSTADTKLEVRRLVEVVDFVRNQIKTPSENYLSLAHVQSNTGELTDVDEQATGTCFTFQKEDVLFARLRPYLNKVYRAEMDGCCSPEFHVLRIKNHDTLLPDYLAAILRSRLTLAQTVHMMTGNTHPRLANEDVVNLKIPIPKPEIQNTISSEVRR
ncbi:MAG TPA: restriction endonuclease subunit S, partial [Bacillota bacterium]|nr:restriction endonuclease subunit S [Bacillota bacterium]